ncbi:hypothetical protein EPK99_13420 [Neorhizobium lilium]|uniref:Secreted protein n=1 Tax=Neorhizobium lilium TaxID=2503024 RepID=A0A3S3VHE5_9HYPH|nr:hypothetical protein [Neorhizobium lilium]RWX76675.1 hypothetical protein EPK99_13420 [Neorhizobium lilium]
MLKGAWILPVIMLVALALAALVPMAASAAEQQTPLKMPDTVYKDLPGVVPQEQRADPDAYTCTSEIADVYIGRGRYDTLFGDTEPRRIYRCKTESGVTYTGTQMPNTQWVPGLNPRDLPR